MYGLGYEGKDILVGLSRFRETVATLFLRTFTTRITVKCSLPLFRITPIVLLFQTSLSQNNFQSSFCQFESLSGDCSTKITHKRQRVNPQA